MSKLRLSERVSLHMWTLWKNLKTSTRNSTHTNRSKRRVLEWSSNSDHAVANLDDIKNEIEDLGHIVTNILRSKIKQQEH